MRNVLAIGAHPDDIELGCGGTIAKHVSSGDNVTMLVVTKGEVGPGRTEDRMLEQARACSVLGVNDLVWGELPDCRVSLYELDLVHIIEDVIRQSRADIIYTHSEQDSHQDHRSVAAATFGAARHSRRILSYDAPSSLHFIPTMFVDVTETIEKKVDALLCHSSQVAASEMVDASRVRNTAGYRGHEARCGSAEAFAAVRFVLDI